MLCMLSYPRRLKSGQITCYLNRTYHVLTTAPNFALSHFAKKSYIDLAQRFSDDN
jgi:hypothetical protein